MTTQHSTLYLWWLAIRPKTLPAAAAPVAVGTAVAIYDSFFALIPALAAFAGALTLQIAVNLANDYFDAKNNIDSEKRLGPVRVTQSGLIPPGQVKMAMIVCLVAASLIFLFLTIAGGLPILLVGVVSVIAALGYSGGPYPLASNGLGELFVFIFFGLVAVCGTYWVQAGELSPLVIVASFPPGLLITAIMVVNNVRDIETDQEAGKNTLAVRLGRDQTILFYRILLGASYFVPVVIVGCYQVGVLVALLPFLSALMGWNLCREIATATGVNLNVTLAKTAKLSFIFSLLFAVGLLL